MSATLSITSNEAAAAALLAIADELTATGYETQSPTWDGSAFLKITNAKGALCDLTITTSGTLTWDYRTHHGSHIHPEAPQLECAPSFLGRLARHGEDSELQRGDRR